MTARRRSGDPLSPFTIDLHQHQSHGLGAAQARALQAAARFSGHAVQAMVSAQTHAIGFAAQRLGRDLETARRLGTCRDGMEAMAVAQAHGIRTAADYAEEATALLRIAMGALGGEVPRRR